MAWDSKSARRRQSSAASGAARTLPAHGRQPSQAATFSISAKSPHVADPFLQDFLDPAFDPAEYLNTTLPSLQTGRGSAGVPLADLSTQAQTTLSQLQAHTTRLTNTLTQLTDDILRSGSRLAYEVELLRGETLSLAEALTEGLEDDVAKFVPGGIKPPPPSERRHSTSAGDGAQAAHQRRLSVAVPAPSAAPEATSEEADAAGATDPNVAPNEPPYITQLRTLTLVRSRLDSVIKTFGDAMEFVFPPSELSVSSSFLSVSAPDAGGDNHSTEEKGQQVLQTLRDEISALLRNKEDPIRGIEEAARRIEELKELTQVWKGTAEEKGRTRFIETLAKIVEDRHRDLMREVEQSARGKAAPESNSRRTAAEDDEVGKGYGAYGLISQLQKLRNGL
ncbi:hypothetical protein GQ53DRAFT_741751 [Thozetella sp. PMI_491]|nr:hypothetical protein GQ53DRAFT_741751 [Thozetella sp. PMI_491]